MESQSTTRERPQPTMDRNISRSSINTRMTTNSAASLSSSNRSPSPLNHGHRFHHVNNAMSASPRPSQMPRRLSREDSIDSARRTPVSSLLQEKLQTKRQVENHRASAAASSASKSNSDMSASIDAGNLHQTSLRTDSDGGQTKGLALKEMEQVVSGLHKQNFDLKLELYHRRERQTALEERMEMLESEKSELEDMNDRLISEMEKRDKAVEEAVAMIIMLEEKVDALTKERNMVRHVEAQRLFSPAYSPVPENLPFRTTTPEPRPEHSEHAPLHRMPSFMSDHSDATQNLRNVYTGVRGSVISLYRVAEGASELSDIRANSMASPSLSVLSKSSFVSVYPSNGQKEGPSTLADLPLSPDGEPISSLSQQQAASSPSRRGTASVPPRFRTPARLGSAGQIQPITSVIEDSPLQRIERMGPSSPPRRDVSRPPSSSRTPAATEHNKLQRMSSRRALRVEKRENLAKVNTDTSGGVSLYEQALPPTPDTVASSTLQRFKKSNDTLDRRQNGLNDRSYDDLHKIGSNEGLASTSQVDNSRVPADAPTIRKTETLSNRLNSTPRPLPQRPRSADESTISYRKDRYYGVDTEDSEIDSFASKQEMWERAGRDGRDEPDLFGFASNGTAWNHSAGMTYTSSIREPLSLSFGIEGASIGPTSDQLFDAIPAEALPAARQPNHARTGPGPNHANQSRGGKRLTQRPRRNSDNAQNRASMKTPVQQNFVQQVPDDAATGQNKQYPPITTQRTRDAVKGFWRRSFGGGPSPQYTSSAPQPTDSQDQKQVVQPTSAVGIRSKQDTGDDLPDDDPERATPAPIGDKRLGCNNAGYFASFDGPTASTAGAADHGEKVTMQAPAGCGNVSTATGTRRSWVKQRFNRHRSNSVKNGEGLR